MVAGSLTRFSDSYTRPPTPNLNLVWLGTSCIDLTSSGAKDLTYYSNPLLPQTDLTQPQSRTAQFSVSLRKIGRYSL